MPRQPRRHGRPPAAPLSERRRSPYRHPLRSRRHARPSPWRAAPRPSPRRQAVRRGECWTGMEGRSGASPSGTSSGPGRAGPYHWRGGGCGGCRRWGRGGSFRVPSSAGGSRRLRSRRRCGGRGAPGGRRLRRAVGLPPGCGAVAGARTRSRPPPRSACVEGSPRGRGRQKWAWDSRLFLGRRFGVGVMWGRVPLFGRALSLGALQLVLQISRVGGRWYFALRSGHLGVPVATGRRSGTGCTSAGQSIYRCPSAGRSRTARTPPDAPGAPRTARRPARPPTDAPSHPPAPPHTPPWTHRRARPHGRRGPRIDSWPPSLPTSDRPRGYGSPQDPCRDGTVAVPWEVPHSERIVCGAVPEGREFGVNSP